ncbi:MAG: hypothetical protein FWG65_07750 [Turicibacter sp.]|nr:hypothetical protein [Turicibacter sp.]
MKNKFLAAFLIAAMVAAILPATTTKAANRVDGALPTISAISSSFAIRADGSLWAWGPNFDGALGDGTSRTRRTPIKILEDVVSVHASHLQNMAIRSDGSLWRWGRQSGDDTLHTPTKIMDDVVAVSRDSGGNVNFVIRSDGSLWGWGFNRRGQLGGASSEITQHSPVWIMDDVIAVSTSGGRTFVIRSDNSLWGWGNGWFGNEALFTPLPSNSTTGMGGLIFVGADPHSRILEPTKIMDDVVAVFNNSRNTFIIRSDGSLWGWGTGAGMDPLGDGTSTANPVPVKIMEDVIAISSDSSGGITMAIRSDGSLWGWGGRGLLFGDDTSGTVITPVRIMEDVIDVSVGGGHVLAIRSDGSLWGWGGNGVGQLGFDSGMEAFFPITRSVRIMENLMLPQN